MSKNDAISTSGKLLFASVTSKLQNIKQLLDEVFVICRIINVEVRVISRAEGEADNSFRDIDNFAYHQKPSPIIVLLYIFSGKD